jgi:deoxyribodipyrimidine photolyase-related protein
MGRLRVILGDQLSQTISCLTGCDKTRDTILMCEVWDEATYVAHHKKKIAFLFSAMRHFARDLRKAGYNIDYIQLDDAENSGSFRGEVNRAITRHAPEQIIVTHPGEYRVLQDMKTWQETFSLPVEIRDDDRFLCGLDEFCNWAKDRTQLRMEFFYRDMRKKHGILLENGKPVGGQWNFDAQNRKPPKDGMGIPAPYQSRPDDITSDVLDLVAARFDNHFGDLQPFHFAVTRQQALNALDQFINQRLAQFGDYQDAMVQNQPWMFHAHIAFYLNCGLLLPLECIKAAENAYYRGDVPLNAAEGFIRQILGWREFVRGIYWLKMPGYGDENYFNATAALPEFYWTAQTRMNCLRHCVQETRANAYAHHIQRLMVLGNFSLLAGISPMAVNEWFLIVYADAYEWVEMPNVTGMVLFADGGYLASKPYAAGGGYINKMSDYCENCSFKVSKKNGPQACPFNYLYWDFLARNRAKLANNHRLGMMYKTYDRMGEDKKQAIADDSARFLKSLYP